MINHNVEVMSAVGRVIEFLATIDFFAWVVERAKRLSPCVAHPPCCPSKLLLSHKLNAIRATFTTDHKLLPVARGACYLIERYSVQR